MSSMILEEQLLTLGYINEPVGPEIRLIREIERMRREKNCVILSHYYVEPELQDIADFVGDSLGLSQQAAYTQADIIVFIGVHFMAETAKILSPGKKVLLPDLKAGCSLAESAPAEDFARFKSKYPDHKVISYINCSAELKTLSDVICTSANAVKIVESFPKDQPLIFAPDKNLGNYINSLTGRNMVLWDGSCMVHEQFSLEKIVELMDQHPEAEFIAHPECTRPVLLLAKFIGSTTALLNYVKKSNSGSFIVATESGILHQMKKLNPGKEFIPVPPVDSTCGCSDCSFMKLNTLQKVYLCMKHEKPEINLPEEIIEKARLPILRMLEISKS